MMSTYKLSMLPLIDYTETVNERCVKCNSKTSNDTTYCKTCQLEIESKTKEINITDIYELPHSETKSRLMEANIHKIFAQWQTTSKTEHIIINNSNRYKILKNVCMNATPNSMSNSLNNLFGLPCKLKAKYADMFLTEIVDSKPVIYQHHYIHTIAPYIFDIWNTTYNNSTFLCYYKDFGELNMCPTNVDRLYSIWGAAVD